LLAILGKGVSLADVLGAVVSGERWLVERDVANEVEGIEVFVDFVGEGVE